MIFFFSLHVTPGMDAEVCANGESSFVSNEQQQDINRRVQNLSDAGRGEDAGESDVDAQWQGFERVVERVCPEPGYENGGKSAV